MSRPTIGSSTNPVEAVYTKRLYANRDNFISVGMIIPYASNLDIPSGYLLCDGSEYSRAIYSDLFAMIGTLYGDGDGSTTFNVPDLRDKFVEGSASAGTEKEAGLPNITGYFTNADSWSSPNQDAGGAMQNRQDGRSTLSRTATDAGNGGVNFDASLSNSIYGNSTTVQPPAITFRYLIKALGVSGPSALPEPELSGATLGENIPLGIIMPYTGNSDVPEGFRLCNGDAISRVTYSDLYNLIGTTYGQGDGSTTFNLPDLRDKFIEGSTTAGMEKKAGLPNIVGGVDGSMGMVSTSTNPSALTLGNPSHGNVAEVNSTTFHGLTFDASRFNLIYGNSDTVQPPALTMRYIIRVVPPSKLEIIESNATIGIGAVQQFLQNSIPDGWLSLEEGSIVSRTTYPNLWAWVQENAPLITDEQWLAKAVTQKAVAYYSTGDGSTTFRLPRLLGFAEGKAAEDVGELTEAGLPNIMGESGVRFIMNNNIPKSGALDGYATQGSESCGLAQGSSNVSCGGVSMNASLSNSIYGNSNTVQPESFGLVWCVKAFGAAIKQGTINITFLANDVAKNTSEKADRSLSNLTDAGKSFTFPSDTYITIPSTQVESGSTYIAPANGYFYFLGISADVNAAVILYIDGYARAVSILPRSDQAAFAWVPMRKGQTVTISHSLLKSGNSTARFYYVQGEVPV